ncbi:MAG TPA: hypothetical protein VJ860_13085 [Polyangia bacterium]|jgi:hypothetical protein|nr:hypothetical protein [Polyangia bacterium]
MMMNTLRLTLVLIAMGGTVATAQAADSSVQPPATEASGDARVASDMAPASGDAGVASEAALTPGAAAPVPEPPQAESEKEHAPESPLLFPGGIRIGGLFDASYERVGMNGSPTSGQNAFRNYHHFVFVSRQGNDIPIGFNAEVINQHFYELTARLWRKGSAFRLSARAGKIMVPFGPDPLFHKNYGGLSAIDQKLLPVVWSSFGACVRADASLKGFSLANDLYFVQGFDVSARDHALNMPSDLQAYDGARMAIGDRVSISHGPVTLWYSLYWNPMRFGRSLLMQAVDLAIWRPAWPVVNRLALGVGVLRALISADSSYGQPDAIADAGAYYDFADYLWLRAYATRWLYLQARSGLMTFNNHKGLSYDSDRAVAADASHHSLSVVAEYAGAQFSLGYYWNFEKVGETANDLLRFMVMYAF